MASSLVKEILDFVSRFDITEEKVKQTLVYLNYFGYLKDIDTTKIDEFVLAVKKFQELAGIISDGFLTAKTVAAMTWPRCGCPDFVAEENATQLNKWGIRDLNYFIASRDTDLSKELWDKALREAYTSIERVCDLQFTQVDEASKAHFVWSVGTGRANNFDGPSGTLAWAQLPSSTNYKGRLYGKFDGDETWVYGIGRGIKLRNVGAHEILHTLGLTHSQVKTALAAPFYNPDVQDPQENDDVARLQARYGKPKKVSEPEPTPVPTPTPVPDNKDIVIRVKGSIVVDGYRLSKLG